MDCARRPFVFLSVAPRLEPPTLGTWMPHDLALIYVAVWSAAVMACGIAVARERREYDILSRAYLRSRLAPWKVVTFLIAATFFVIAAPYTGDPTWDHVDGAFMSVLTYVTAPWAVGVVVRVRRGLLPRRQLFVAMGVAMFAASWSYDGYVFLRDGIYPQTWWSNILASGTLYTSAGMMWSLTHVPGRGVVFDFMTDDWYRTPPARFRKVVIVALLVSAGMVLAMLPFAKDIASALNISARP